MAASAKTAKCKEGDEVDRISELPIHLIESILECLPVKDAMRTSILSRKWKYSWTGLRYFDLEPLWLESVEVFRKTVDRILLLHSGPIHVIKFFIPAAGNHLDFNLLDWFHVLSQKGIQDVAVYASHTENRDFGLPCSLFQCSDLKYLGLYSCKLTAPPNSVGFNNLVDLVIYSCMVPSHVLGSLISHCPLLEELTLAYTCTKYSAQPLVISALNLRTLFFEDELFGTIVFQNIPRLSYATLLAPIMEIERPCVSWDFICSLHGIRELQFHILLLGPVIGNYPRCFPMRLENLKTLGLYDVNACVEDDMRLVLCFIRSSPCLQDLRIEFDTTKSAWLQEPKMSRENAQKLLETEAREQCKLSDLSTVEFESFDRLRHETILAKVMLSRCPNLNLLRICPVPSQRTRDVMMQISREFEKLPNKEKFIYEYNESSKNAKKASKSFVS